MTFRPHSNRPRNKTTTTTKATRTRTAPTRRQHDQSLPSRYHQRPSSDHSHMCTDDLFLLTAALTDQTNTNPHADTIIERIQKSSALHKIISTKAYIPFHDPKPSPPTTTTTQSAIHTITETLALANSIDKVIASVPYSIRTFYVKLLTAATYESLNLDIPYDCEYLRGKWQHHDQRTLTKHNSKHMDWTASL